MKTLMILIAMSVLVVGCATRPPKPPPLTPNDIISMTKAGLSDQEIMRRIDATRSVFRLSSTDVINLRNQGVGEPVVNFMLDTYVRYVRYMQSRQDYYDSGYYWPYGVGIWYGPRWHRW